MKTPRRRSQPQSMCDGFRVQQIQKQTEVSAVVGSLVDWQLPFGGPWCLWSAGETVFHRLYRSLQSKTCQAVSSWCICAFVRMYTVQHLKKKYFLLFGCITSQLKHAGSSFQHVGSQFPDQGRNLSPCIGSMEPQPWDHQGSPSTAFLNRMKLLL